MTGPANDADVIVVGGGPAGSTTAGILADAGWRVLLLERYRFPRAKPCGECLNPGAVAALDRLGLMAPVAHVATPIRGWDIHCGSGARASGRFAPRVRDGIALPRSVLDQVLLDEAKRRGVQVREEVRVTGVTPAARSRCAIVRAEDSHRNPMALSARFVVGADGLRSIVSRSVSGLRRTPRLRKASITFHLRGAGPPPDRGRLLLSDLGTVGLAPLGPAESHTRPQYLWNLTVVAPASRARSVLVGPRDTVAEAALRRVAPEWRGVVEHADAAWGSGPFDFPARPFPAPGVILVGDAAGYFDPLTGQGIYRALRSAELAAESIDQALRDEQSARSALSGYERRLQKEFRSARRLQRCIEFVVSSARLRPLVLARLARTSNVLDALIRVTGDARPSRSLVSPTILRDLAGFPRWAPQRETPASRA